MVTHVGERYVQRRAGFNRDGLGSAGMGVRLPPVARQFLREQRMLMVAGRDTAGAVWVSALYGPPGFINAEGEQSIVVATRPAAGHPLNGVLVEGCHIGALAIEPATRRRMRINGVIGECGEGLRIEADQVFSNCPKYITPRAVVGHSKAVPSVRHTGELSADDTARIAEADTLFIGTYADGIGADVSHRGGEPGFVSVTGRDRLSWPEYRGNAMFMTLGNLHVNPRCGLLFPDWSGTGPALHLTGRAHVDWDTRRIAAQPAEPMVDFIVDKVTAVAGPTLLWRNL